MQERLTKICSGLSATITGPGETVLWALDRSSWNFKPLKGAGSSRFKPVPPSHVRGIGRLPESLWIFRDCAETETQADTPSKHHTWRMSFNTPVRSNRSSSQKGVRWISPSCKICGKHRWSINERDRTKEIWPFDIGWGEAHCYVS